MDYQANYSTMILFATEEKLSGTDRSVVKDQKIFTYLPESCDFRGQFHLFSVINADETVRRGLAVEWF